MRQSAKFITGLVCKVGVLAILACSACVTKPRLDAPPSVANAAPVGFPLNMRTNSLEERFVKDRADSAIAQTAASETDGSFDILALSGGGAGGAFGAGVLSGLTKAGRRPTFEVVTGVSSGALMAPFAFLGSDWDNELKDAYTGGYAQSIKPPSMVGAAFNLLFNTGALKVNPVRELVEHFATDRFIAAIAKAASTGRKLLVATTDLDNEETVIWNLGEIARQGGPKARQLFIDVLVASASVPGVFPPVLIDVAAGGKRYQEMHVDGGTSTPFIVLPNILNVIDYRSDHLKGGSIFVIFNSQLSDPSRTTAVNTADIAQRSFYTALNHLTRAALLEASSFAERNQMQFQFTVIPQEYPYAGSLDFGATAMGELFNYGEQCGVRGQVWLTPREAVARVEGPLVSVAADAPCPLLAPTSK
jgi:predicted acylesterase/phospholipase RssA